jgi:predicted phage tail protein
MFGKTRDINGTDTLDSSAIDEFFGDEAAAATSVEIHGLRDRVEQVEAQINSQFTSLATYAQIAQEQVELARAEARAATERSEQRVTSLIERERADRLTSHAGTPPGSSPDITARLDALEHSVARIQQGLDESRQQQKDLARAISAMFDTLTASSPSRSASVPAPTAAPAPLAAPLPGPPAPSAPLTVEADGPISGLAFDY